MKEYEKDLAKLMRVFERLHKNWIRWEFDKSGLGELTNPQILFIVGKHDPKFKKFLEDGDCQPAKQQALTQRDVAEIIGVSAPTVAVSIKRMEKAGLMYKKADEVDLRKNHLYLTDKGKKLILQCIGEEERILSAIIKGFSDEEIIQLCEFYIRMVKNMEELGAKIPKLI